jgi:hypothetical protein
MCDICVFRPYRNQPADVRQWTKPRSVNAPPRQRQCALMGSVSSRSGSGASAASAASTSPSACPRRFKGKSYAGLADPRPFTRESVYTLEALADVNLMAGTDFGLDDFMSVSEWCQTTAARAEAVDHELQPRKGVNLFSHKAKRREETPAGDTLMLLRKLARVTALANVAIVKLQEAEAAGLREKYGRKLVPSSLIELLRGPRSPTDWDEIDDLLVGALPSQNVAERRLCALALSLQTLSETMPAGVDPWI